MEENYSFITDFDKHLFNQGTHYEIYDKMGAHLCTINGVSGAHFAVWAPNAQSVSVVGDFNGWNEEQGRMSCLGDGIYEAFIPGAKMYDNYKYMIVTANGNKLYKADPYAFYAEKRPLTASKIADISKFKWSDKEWLNKQEQKDIYRSKISIYEVHIGSWKKHPLTQEDEDGYYTYREIAEELADYVLDMGYTHIELMGILEHPYDGSWGYQVTGYYAPTSRYGEPSDFMYFVNYMHKRGIGIILDWVPAHFPKDAHGLADFDGSHVYEYEDPRKGEHPDWGTKVFDFGRNQVVNFLIANALFWIERYHVDGIRVDAVASMLYLDYGRQDGDWVRNKYGDNKNLEAIEFLRHMNSVINQRDRRAITIAEESTAWPMVTKGSDMGGLGFTFKWNMGWMHDFLEYMQQDPLFRKGNHHKMTFGISYAFSENFILVLSHDEVVHLKKSMISKMPGEYEDKFKNLKAGYTFMIGHPGKKLLFMGQEFGQWNEWNEKVSLDWNLLNENPNKDLKDYWSKCLKLYSKYPVLSEGDCDADSFKWINCNDEEKSIYSYVRMDKTGKNNLLFVFNFTPVKREDMRVGVPFAGKYTLLLDSLNLDCKKSVRTAKEMEWDGQPYSIPVPMEGLQALVFSFDKSEGEVKKTKATNTTKQAKTTKKTTK